MVVEFAIDTVLMAVACGATGECPRDRHFVGVSVCVYAASDDDADTDRGLAGVAAGRGW